MVFEEAVKGHNQAAVALEEVKGKASVRPSAGLF